MRVVWYTTSRCEEWRREWVVMVLTGMVARVVRRMLVRVVRRLLMRRVV